MESNTSIAAIRSLCIDMINKANSGHPGTALDAAPALYTLFTKELRVNPQIPQWFNRDRFVLASGHASALLYSLLHLSGYALTMDDLKAFRQWGSKTPGHPERQITKGVDAASGPLGQGVPEAVGMAFAEKFLSERYNKDGFDVVDHFTYALCGDGDMMEGVTQEAASLAGHLALGKLIVLYDANDVTLDGPLSLAFSEDVKKRFEAMNWQVIVVKDGNDTKEVLRAIRRAKRESYKPSLIILKTVIGYGAPLQGTSKVHGTPLGVEGGKAAKAVYGYDYDEFTVPDEVYDDFKKSVFNRGLRNYKKWMQTIDAYADAYPDDYKELVNAIENNFTLDITELQNTIVKGAKEATRNVNEKVIQEVAKQNPTYLSGTADLQSSTKTKIYDAGNFGVDDYQGRNVFFGIREFGMTSIMNGIALHGGICVSGGGFMVFSDYQKAGLRMSTLMSLPIILPFSHDSIAVGEDGPTHQPVEQLAGLRSMIDLNVIRPADAYETVAAWKLAVESKNVPTALILSRQALVNETEATYDDVRKGAYIVSKEGEGALDGIILAAGSEVNLALATKRQLSEMGYNVRVVSMPCQRMFEAQEQSYKESVLPKSCRKRLAIEMSNDPMWYRYVGLDGAFMHVDTFGTSAKADRIIEEYGFTVEEAVKRYLAL